MGAFDEAVLGLWCAGPRIVVDPFTSFRDGSVAMRIIGTIDVAFPRRDAFVKIESINHMSTIKFRVLRPVIFRGERQEAGTVLRASPLEAANLLDSGRAELCDQDDAAIVAEARRAELQRIMFEAGPVPRLSEGSWRRC